MRRRRPACRSRTWTPCGRSSIRGSTRRTRWRAAGNPTSTTTACVTTGFVAGYFFGADLITTAPFATGNNAEIFYSIVPDASGSVSCQHSVSQVTGLVPVTFVHEFQHMISFNQHFLVPAASPEDLWLNEGLSHNAEENGGRTYLPDSTTFCT